MEKGTIQYVADRRRFRAQRPPRHLGGRQFAEAFYLMVMASELRGRARALGRRYGLESMDMRAEVLRYLERVCTDLPPEA
jgi:hypothetical protein